MPLNVSIRSKVVIALLTVGLGCLVVGGLLGYWAGDTALRDKVTWQLTSERDTKRLNVEAYAANLRCYIRAIGASMSTLEITRAFVVACQGLDAEVSPQESKALEAYYRGQYLPQLNRVAGGNSPLEALVPSQSTARRLQMDYIVNNPNPPGESQKLVSANTQTEYDAVHARYHPELQRLVEVTAPVGVRDILLVDASTGDVVYSVSKNPDFATNLFTGPYMRSGAARAVLRALDPLSGGGVVLIDFSAYAPAGLSPRLFGAIPVIGDGRTLGIFVVAVDVSAIDGLLNDNQRWEATRQGRTGEVIMVGDDGLFRSQSRFLAQQPDDFFRMVHENGISEETVHQIRTTNSPILYLRTNTIAVSESLRGHAGIAQFRDYRGVPVVAAFAPVSDPELHWAIEAKQDQEEAFAPVARFQRNLLLVAGVAAVALSSAALLWASIFFRPLGQVVSGMAAILRGGDASTRVRVRGGDEFGELAQGFNAMAEAIATRDRRIAEQEADRARLLCDLYPKLVAERVSSGAAITAETFPNVTMVVVSIDGLDWVTVGLAASEGENRLNAALAALTEAANAHGLEMLNAATTEYVAVCGLSSPRLDHAQRALRFAEAASNGIEGLAVSWSTELSLRAGVCSGNVEGGLIGTSGGRFSLWGRTVAIARSMAASAENGWVQVSETTFNLLPDAEGFVACAPIENLDGGRVVSWAKPLPTPMVFTIKRA